MAFVDLTDEQKADFEVADKALRGFLSSLYSLRRSGNWVGVKQFIADNVTATFAELAAADELPNFSGLGSAKPLTKAQWTALYAFLGTDVMDKLETNLAFGVKAVGVNA